MGIAYRAISMRKLLLQLGMLCIVIIFASAGHAFAQSTADASICGDDPLAKLFCSTSLSAMLDGAFQASISLGAILAMLRIGYAGYLYMGSDFWGTKQHAKDVFRDAVVGLLILLAIYLILFQINPQILSLDILKTLPQN